MKRLHHHLCRKSPLYHRWHQHPLHKHVHWGLFGAVALGVALSFVILGWQEQSAPFSAKAQEATITIDGSRQYQTIDGWGANSQEGLVNAEVYQKFVQDLGATIVRIPFPAAAEGAAESANDNPDPSDLNLAAFDITRQVFRKEVSVNLESVKQFERAGVDKFLLAVFSPPLWMKEPPRFVDESDTSPLIQVPAIMYPEFAETIIGVIRRFAQEGITIEYVNLQGENMCRDTTVPHTCWGEESFRDMLKEVGSRLRTALPNVRIGVPNVSRPTTGSYWSAIKSDSAAYQYADIQMVHYYEWGESKDIEDAFQAMGSDVLNDQKPLWIAETGGPGFDGSTADTFQEGFNEAQKIHQSFTIGNASAFLEYVAYMDAGSSGSNVHRLWRLIELQGDGSIEGFSPKYYAMKRYSRNIPPGSKRIEVSGAPAGVKVSAFTHTNGTFTIVAINTTRSDQGIVFKLSGGVSASSLNRYRFSSGCSGLQTKGNANIAAACDQNVGPINISSNASFMDSLPSQSITTFTTGTANVPPPTPQVYACSDGQDNDVDGKIDYRTDGTGDPGCTSSTDTSEDDVSPPADGWTFCANENEFCSFSGTKEVRYGANGSYRYLTLTGGTQCSNAVFGDPINGVVKQCHYRDTTTGGPVCPNGTCEPPSETNSTCPQDCGSTQNQPPRNLVLRYLGPTPTGGNLCGNPPGRIDPGEQCDGTNLGGATCPLGQTGSPTCTASCTLDTSSCSNPPAQVCTPNQTCASCYTSQNCAGVCNAQGTGWVDRYPNDGCPAVDTSGPPYPRLGVFTFSGMTKASVDILENFDVIAFNLDNTQAQRYKQANPNRVLLRTTDSLTGYQLPIQVPSQWLAKTAGGTPIELWGGGANVMNITRYSPKVDVGNGPETFADWLIRWYRETIDFNYYDGIMHDWWWSALSQGQDVVDFNNNGVADRNEGIDVQQLWRDSLIEFHRREAQIPGLKYILVQIGEKWTAPYVNGADYEDWPDFHGQWNYWKDYHMKEAWEQNPLARKPQIMLLNAAHTQFRKYGLGTEPYKNNYRAVRFALGSALMGSSFIFVDEGNNLGHHGNFHYYDEFEGKGMLGYPLGGERMLLGKPKDASPNASGVWVRFFDQGVALVNASGVNQAVTASDLAALDPVVGSSYYRIQGGQDPTFNNGRQVTTADPLQLWGTTVTRHWPDKDPVGDGTMLFRAPKTLIAPIIVDNNVNNQTSPGSEAVSYSGTWNQIDGCNDCYAYYTGRNYAVFQPYGYAITNPNSGAQAVYTPNIGVAGQYRVYEWHGRLNSGTLASNVTYTINNATRVNGPCGGITCTINQQLNSGQWNEVGTYRFNAGTAGNVTISASGANGTVMADAVMFRYVGP